MALCCAAADAEAVHADAPGVAPPGLVDPATPRIEPDVTIALTEPRAVAVLRPALFGPLPDGTALHGGAAWPLAAMTMQLEPAPPGPQAALELPSLAVAEPAPMPRLHRPTEPAAAADESPVEATESLRDAIVAALKGNPEIQIALAQQDDARYAVNEARAGYLPHIDMTLAYGREMAKAGHAADTWRYRTEGSVTLNQNLWDFGVTINDIKRARASYRSAQWGTRERIEAIAYDITNAYLGVVQRQKLVDLGGEEIAATQKILRIVTVQKDLGLTTQADIDRAQSRLQNVQSALLDRKSALQQARNSYRRLTDHLPGAVGDLPGAAQALPVSAEGAVDLLATHSPALAQAVEDRRSLEKQYDSQASAVFPRIGLQLQGNYKYDVMGATGRADDARAMVTVSYRLFNGGADSALKHRIGARLRQSDFELDRRRREVEQDIRIDYEALDAARQKIATINGEIDSAQSVVQLYRQQFREGKRTVFDLLDSEQILFGARAAQVTNAAAMQAAEYRVLQKLGGLFDLVSGGEALPPLEAPAPGNAE